MAKRVPFVCGNWKMHHGVEATRKQVRALVEGLARVQGKVEVAVAPVATTLFAACEAARGSGLKIAAQNVHWAEKGAFTGEWSAAHLVELGVSHAICGHSERRAMFGDDDVTVPKRVRAALDAGLIPIACVGETLAEREGNQTAVVVARQTGAILELIKADEVERLVLAYEPVWAIGTGKNATPTQAQEVHAQIRALLAKRYGAKAEAVRLQYGGSVKPDNAAELMREHDVDGALVGGAALEAASLLAIAEGGMQRA
ncbi:MAG: triose-phosphate isomerase [Deltaproteobacteria bacterium]|nr:triose-phosphate isomerase [Deltaproteobacteria bacterium]